MQKKVIKIFVSGKEKIKKDYNLTSLLTDIRKDLSNELDLPFKFIEGNGNEISKEDESKLKLIDILDLNLLLKKDMAKRIMLGQKLITKEKLNFYLFPQKNLDKKQKEISKNILVIGETGVGKSSWLHCLLNYLQDIQFEEENRYLLFDEKSMLEQYEKKYGKKCIGESVTSEPSIYNIESTKVFNFPIRIIDTPGYGDTRGPETDKKIIQDLKKLLEDSSIEYINTVCLFFKYNQTRQTFRLKPIMDQLISLFGVEIKHNVVFIFTFCWNFNDFSFIKYFNEKNGPVYEIFGDINQFHHYLFNNYIYFTGDIVDNENIFEKNKKGFKNFLEHISSLNPLKLILHK